MIVKRIDNPKQGSTKAARIGGLADYIGANGEKQVEKVELTFATGDFYSESWQTQRAEMIALATESKGSDDPVDHWLLSWKEGEIPTEAQSREAVGILRQRLGLRNGHMAMCALHRNTDNYHLHVVFNRVDPETFRVADNGWCIEKAHKAVAEIVCLQGWEPEANARYTYTNDGEVARNGRDHRHQPKVKTLDRENATGEQSCERLAIEKAAPLLDAAQNWAQVHSELARVGMRYEAKGSGALIWVGNQPVKASVAGRQFSRTRMEERLGVFEAAPELNAKISLNRTPEPLNRSMPAIWTKYQTAQSQRRREKEASQLDQRRTHRAERETLFAAFRDERSGLRKNGTWRGDALNVARSLLAADQARRKARLQERHRRERDELQKRFGKRLTYEQYLADNGEDREAGKWRFRNSPVLLGRISGEGEAPVQVRDICDFVAQMEVDQSGHVTGIEYRKKSSARISFTDRGKRIDVVQIADEAVVLAAFQVASQKWGVVTVDGPIEFKLLCAEVAAKHGFKLKNSEMQTPVHSSNDVPPMRDVNPYEAHKADILKRIDVPNSSRLDWMIAIRLRVTGHSRQAIEELLKRNAPKGRTQEERDWSKYAERTAQAVFGPRGDRECQHCKSRAAAWVRVEGRDLAPRIICRRNRGHGR